MALTRTDGTALYWDRTGLLKLLAGVFIGPAAWGLNLGANYSLVKWACASGTPQVLPLLSAAAFCLVAYGFVLSWAGLARVRHEASGDRPVHGRNRFLAVSGLWLNALFALLILTSGSLPFIVGPCQ
jgi:hypothetical protein